MKFKKIFILNIFLFLVCCEKQETKILYPNSDKVKFFVESKKSYNQIKEYDKNGNLIMLSKFKDNQFIDSIYYYGDIDYFIKIDSANKDFFYGTQIVKYFSGKNAYIGTKRFTKNKNFITSYESRKKYGKEDTFEEDGRLRTSALYKIIGDSSILVSEKIYDDKLEK